MIDIGEYLGPAVSIGEDLITYRKLGFSVPLAHWFGNETKDTVGLAVQRLAEHGLVQASYARKIFNMHLKGGRDFSAKRYTILFFDQWWKSDQCTPMNLPA